MEKIVVAMGGNALARSDERGTYAEQKAHAGQLASVVRSLLRGGYRVLVTHGNGPQVGNLAVQQEEGSHRVPPQPLSVLSAMTQGQIGHLLVAALTGTQTGPTAVSVITHTVVEAGDAAFGHPAKPVGTFLSEQQARALTLSMDGRSPRNRPAAGGASSHRPSHGRSSRLPPSGCSLRPDSSSSRAGEAASR